MQGNQWQATSFKGSSIFPFLSSFETIKNTIPAIQKPCVQVVGQDVILAEKNSGVPLFGKKKDKGFTRSAHSAPNFFAW